MSSVGGCIQVLLCTGASHMLAGCVTSHCQCTPAPPSKPFPSQIASPMLLFYFLGLLVLSRAPWGGTRLTRPHPPLSPPVPSFPRQIATTLVFDFLGLALEGKYHHFEWRKSWAPSIKRFMVYIMLVVTLGGSR